ncbi:MAG: HAD-IA family hydrolase [Cardiobacteriaceae bacterium]|nr:HAD-IA family hydrolase [Cardiobacteriaceae bacterium]
MSIQLVLFDCDGVLVDSETLTSQVFINLAREHGIALELPHVLEHFVGRALEDNIRHVEHEHGITLPADFADRFRAQSLVALAASVTAIPGIHETLDALDAAHLPYAVASSGRPEKMRTTLGATGLLPRFANRMFSTILVAAPKPAPDVYLLAAQTLNTAPENCLVIEDSTSGIRAGVAAGMTVYAYAAHAPADKLLAAGAHRTFNDMRELPPLIAEINGGASN